MTDEKKTEEKKQPLPEGVDVFWLRAHPKPVKRDSHVLGAGQPVTLVAYELRGAQVLYSTATHNPPDVFSRKNAFDKALGKLKSKSPENVNLIEVDPQIGPEASIAKHIIVMIEERYPQCIAMHRRSLLAAQLTFDDLVARYKRRRAKRAEKKE